MKLFKKFCPHYFNADFGLNNCYYCYAMLVAFAIPSAASTSAIIFYWPSKCIVNGNIIMSIEVVWISMSL